MTTQSIKALFEPILKNPIKHKSLYFNYLQTLLDFLDSKVFDSIENQKSIVITLSDEKMVHKLEVSLEAYNNFLLTVTDNHPISKENIAKLRLRAKMPDSYPNHIEYSLQRQKMENSYSKLITQFDVICSNPLYKKYSLNAPISNTFYLNLPILSYHIDRELFSFEAGEIDQLKSFISEVSNLYKKQFSLYEDVSKHTSSSILNSPCDYTEILKTQINSAKELVRIFSYQLNDYQDSYRTSISKTNNSQGQLIIELSEIEEKYRLLSVVNEKQVKKGIFQATHIIKRKAKYKQFQENIFVQFEAWRSKLHDAHPALFDLFQFKEEKTLEANIEIAKQILQTANTNLKSTNQIEKPAIEQLNLRNCPEIFKKLIEDIEQFYKQINESNTLIVERNMTSFNLMNEYNYLVTISNRLSQLEGLIINYPDYIEWLCFTTDLSEVENAILSTFSCHLSDLDNWNLLFEEYYYHLFITNKLSNLQNLSTDLEDLNEIDEQMSMHLKGYINHLLNEEFTSDLTTIKNNNNQLFKSLFQKKYDQANLSDIDVNMTDKSFFSLFPISIMSRQYWNALSEPNKIWDEHIYIDTDKFEKDVKHGIGDELFYHLKFPIDEYQFDKKLLANGSYHLIEDTKEYVVHPKLRTDQDLLSFARGLSSKLERYQNCFRIFQINKRFIICFLNEDIIRVLISVYSQYGLKEFRIDQDLNYSLSDILLQEPENISFITQDLLIDPNSINSLKWQYYLLGLMSRSGMKWHNIPSYEILEYGLESILEEMNFMKNDLETAALTTEIIIEHA